MPQYRKKPIVIEAVQFNGDIEVLRLFCWQARFTQDNRVVIPTPEGQMECKPKDWVIKGIQGEFYPCKPDIFEASYEEVKVNEDSDSY